jgi:hypothetical protein
LSSFVTILQKNAAHILTDGSIYEADGTLVGIGPKVRLLPHLNAAMALRGPHVLLAPIAEGLSAATSFDVLKEGIVSTLQAYVEHCPQLFQLCEAGREFEVVVAGISETAGPSAYLVASHDRYGEPWTVIELTGLSLTPSNDAVLGGVAETAAGRDADDLDPEVDGLAILQAQRSAYAGAFVGGFAQLTTIDGAGVHSRVIHRWNDWLVKDWLRERAA